MLLIPVFWKTTDTWLRLGIFFCDGGRSIWEVDDSSTDSDIKTLLEDNNMPLISITKHANTAYAKIDIDRLNLNEFYTWDEVNQKTSTLDVWRILQIPRGLWSCRVFREELWNKIELLKSKHEPIDRLLDE
jgi:hypothetical protein